MKKINFTILVTLFVQCVIVNGQDKDTTGLSFLSSTKNTIEETIGKMKRIPDTSAVYIATYNQLNNLYIKTSSSYIAYRSEMVTCILNSKKSKQARQCLKMGAPDLKSSLDSLFTLTDRAYNEYYHTGGKRSVLLDLVAGIISGLVDGGVKIWDKIDGKTEAVKKAITDEVKSESYNLKPFDQLLPCPKKPGTSP